MQHNEYPTAPGALLGHTKYGQPIHLIAGGSGEGEGEGGQPDPAEDAPESGATEPASQPNPPTSDPNPEGEPAANPADTGADDRSARTIAAIREDFKTERAKRQAAEKKVTEFQAQLDEVKATQASQMDGIAKALGLKPDDTPPDPKVLTEKLAAAQAEAGKRADSQRESEVKLAVYRLAAKNGADTDALLDSASFLRAVSTLDPTADDFTTQVGDAITSAIEANPRYKVPAPAVAVAPKPPVKAKSGGEFTGAPGGNRQWTDEDVKNASPSEVAKAIDDGLLVDLGFNAPRPKR